MMGIVVPETCWASKKYNTIIRSSSVIISVTSVSTRYVCEVWYGGRCSDHGFLIPCRYWDILLEITDHNFSYVLYTVHSQSFTIVICAVVTYHSHWECSAAAFIEPWNLNLLLGYFHFRLVYFHPTLWKKL